MKSFRSIGGCIALILTAIVVFSLTISSAAVYLGDMDGNGSVTTADARAVLRVAVRLETLDAALASVADVNQDGLITTYDARQALRMAVGLAPLREQTTLAEPATTTPDPADPGVTEPVAPSGIACENYAITAQVAIYENGVLTSSDERVYAVKTTTQSYGMYDDMTLRQFYTRSSAVFQDEAGTPQDVACYVNNRYDSTGEIYDIYYIINYTKGSYIGFYDSVLETVLKDSAEDLVPRETFLQIFPSLVGADVESAVWDGQACSLYQSVAEDGAQKTYYLIYDQNISAYRPLAVRTVSADGSEETVLEIVSFSQSPDAYFTVPDLPGTLVNEKNFLSKLDTITSFLSGLGIA